MTRILLVEDTPANTRLFTRMLASAGYDVQSVDTAEAAPDALRQWPPDLLLLDLQLPGMSGIELAQQLKADPLLAQIPIVALTAYAMKGDEERAIAAGCIGYITKPIDTRTFLPAIARLLRSSQPLPQP